MEKYTLNKLEKNRKSNHGMGSLIITILRIIMVPFFVFMLASLSHHLGNELFLVIVCSMGFILVAGFIIIRNKVLEDELKKYQIDLKKMISFIKININAIVPFIFLIILALLLIFGDNEHGPYGDGYDACAPRC